MWLLAPRALKNCHRWGEGIYIVYKIITITVSFFLTFSLKIYFIKTLGKRVEQTTGAKELGFKWLFWV